MNSQELTLGNLSDELKNGKITSLEIAREIIANIRKQEEKLNAYITQVAEEEVLSMARKIDEKNKDRKNFSPLSGIPVAVKDNISVKGLPLTCASKILTGYTALYDATAVRKLKEKDAIILGKTNMDEFAMGSTGEYSYFGPTKNPLNTLYVPGGSSSGSAAAVASNMAVYALGSDTGGSVRLPAFFTGTVGFKPTYGRISRYGLVAFASSLDQIGIITRNVMDSAMVFSEISGYDPLDSTSYEENGFVLSELKGYESERLTIGVPVEYLNEGVDDKIQAYILDVIERYKKAGYKIKEISLPHTKYAIPVYQVVSTSEASANLSRYDGIRYGLRIKGDTPSELYQNTRTEGFGDEVKRRIMLGTFCLSSGYYDAYYARAQKVRRHIKSDFDRAFENVDIIITPTSPTFPIKIGTKIKDPVSLYLLDVFTTTANLAGIPAIAIPGKEKLNGEFKSGFQLLAPAFREANLFKAGLFFENYIS